MKRRRRRRDCWSSILDITVVVAPDIITELRERLPEEVRDRVVTWQ